MSDRGMKKWLPYKSLTEQGSYLSEVIERKSFEERPVPLEGQSEKTDAFLRRFAGGEVALRYYAAGHVLFYRGVPDRVDLRRRQIVFPSFEIPFSDIVQIIEEEDFDIPQ